MMSHWKTFSDLAITEELLHFRRFFQKMQSAIFGKGWMCPDKKQYNCSNCRNVGHTIKTCTAECKNCGMPACCTHLIKHDMANIGLNAHC